MGLLDILQSDDPVVKQGILQFGLSLLGSKGKFGNAVGGAGMAGLQGAQQFKQNQQNTEYRKMQIADMQAQQAQRQAQADAMARKAQEEERIKGLLSGAFAPIGGGDAATMGAGPTNAAAASIGQPRQVNYQQLIAQGLDPKLAEALANAPKLGQSKVARTIEAAGPNGRPMTRQYDEYGQAVGEGIPKAVEAKLMNLGGVTKGIDPYGAMGQSFQHTMTPEGRDSSARGWAGVNMQREKMAQEKEGAKWQYDATRGVQINPMTGEARPVTMDGKPLGEKGTNTDKSKQTAELAYSTIDKLLKHPGLDTAVGLSGQLDPRNYIWGTKAKGAQALVDQAQGQAFLQAFDSLKGGGQITEVEGRKATEAIARLQRSQSEADFKAAAKELQDLADMAHQRAGGGPLKPATATSGRTVLRFDANGNPLP